MDLILTGFIAGVLGTLMMDSLNRLFARYGVISKIDIRIIGRMAVGWAKGRFRYTHPNEMEPAPNEIVYGYFTHYAIGVGSRSRSYLVGISWLVDPCHRYGHLSMESRQR